MQKKLDTNRPSDIIKAMDSSKCSQAVKIKGYKVRAAGRGQTIALPQVWIDDLRLKPGDQIEIFRDTEDRLILVAKKDAST